MIKDVITKLTQIKLRYYVVYVILLLFTALFNDTGFLGEITLAVLIIFTVFLILKYWIVVRGRIKHVNALFVVSVIIFVFYRMFLFNQRFLFDFGGYLYDIMDVYLGIFTVFFIMKNQSEIKAKLYDKPVARIITLIDRNDNYKKDLLHFVILSLVITLLSNVMFSAVGGKEILDFIPGFSDYSDLSIPLHGPKVEDAALLFGRFFPGPPLGILIVVILRQFRYRERKRKETNEQKKEGEKYPGARILLLFLMIVPIILILDAYSITQENAQERSAQNQESDNEPVHPIYEIGEFFKYYLTNPWYYSISVVTWAFDRYVFSRLW